MEEDVVRARLVVKGRVQGVFYRQSTRDKATGLCLNGWVANAVDGSVVIEVEGRRSGIDELIAWCRQGPPSARVTAVEIEWLVKNLPLPQGFAIRNVDI